jgi:hypothetical protein
MAEAVVIRGRYVGQRFIPDEPLPTVEGAAELIVFVGATPSSPTPPRSIFDLFGKAATLRTGEDIAEQIREERDGWGEA